MRTWAQAPADTVDAVPTMERVLDDMDEDDASGEELAELLSALAENPIDINTAAVAELAQLPSLTPAVARAVVAHRTEHGPFGSLPELHSVDGLSREAYLRARPYLRIGEQAELARGEPSPYVPAPSLGTVVDELQFSLLQRVGRRVDLGPGYDRDTTRTTYAGSATHLYTRLRARYERRVMLALTMEKDAGERFAWDPGTSTYGYDHVSGHLALSRMGRLKRLVLGDYVLNYGQGLLLWRTGAFGKGNDAVGAVARVGDGVHPFASSTENTFFRGAAATVFLTPDATLTAFASRRRLDASFAEPDTLLGSGLEGRLISSLRESGLHRTTTELAGKDVLGETLAGGALEWTLGPASVGAAAYHARYDDPFERDPRPYARYQFSGDEATAASVFGRVHAGPAYLFGEAARGARGRWAGIAGALFEADRSFDAVVLVRHYPRDFQSLHGYAFGERNGTTQNESGLYLGLRVRPSRAWSVSAYYDQYRFPYLRYATPRPTTGHDVRLVIEHRPRPWLDYYLQLRSETREAGVDRLDPRLNRLLDGVRPETRQSARLQADYDFSRQLDVRVRAEGVRWNAPGQHEQFGLLLYQQLRWSPSERLAAYVRLAFFDTDDWSSRVYAYENDLLYTFAVPVFSGRGQRAFILMRAEPIERLVLEVKAGVTHYEDVETVGSGLDEVEGRRLREVRGQLRWRL